MPGESLLGSSGTNGKKSRDFRGGSGCRVTHYWLVLAHYLALSNWYWQQKFHCWCLCFGTMGMMEPMELCLCPSCCRSCFVLDWPGGWHRQPLQPCPLSPSCPCGAGRTQFLLHGRPAWGLWEELQTARCQSGEGADAAPVFCPPASCPSARGWDMGILWGTAAPLLIDLCAPCPDHLGLWSGGHPLF